MYITIEEYMSLYDLIDEHIFNLLVFDACRVMDKHTTGIDNVKKLREFFPTDKYDAMAVKNCAAKLINTMYQIQQAENLVSSSRGYVETDQGIRGKIISSISAGNESISYSAVNSSGTMIDAAATDKSVRDKLLSELIKESLSGVTDCNGVNLLYMGKYPWRRI